MGYFHSYYTLYTLCNLCVKSLLWAASDLICASPEAGVSSLFLSPEANQYQKSMKEKCTYGMGNIQ